MEMISNHLHNGMESAKLMWSRLPNSEDGEFDGLSPSETSSGGGRSVESLDYEVIENYAYREEQVPLSSCLYPCVCVFKLISAAVS